jgi:amiloride-sensitive sodium channel
MKNSFIQNVSLFATESSIHGVKYVLDQNSRNLSKILFTVSFIVSIFGLTFYAHGIYEKFSTKPDLVTKTQHIPMQTIPFPAITICSPIFARPEFVNVTDYYHKSLANPKSITEHEKKFFIANMHACTPSTIGNYASVNELPDASIVELIKASAVDTDEMFDGCGFDTASKCKKILTDRGICWTSNLQSFGEIFNPKTISEDFYYETPSNDSIWSLDRGYSTDASDKQPFRASKRHTFMAFMHLDDELAGNVCLQHGKSFTFILHMPNEIATIFHDENSIGYGIQKHAVLTAVSYRTDEALRSYSPDIRGCYFEDEKKLRFFRSYTKNHCDLECLTNFTLAKCGCVKFSMPRDKATPVCGASDAWCYAEAMESWPEVGDGVVEAPCGCLKTCNSIEYAIKYEKESSNEHFEDLIAKVGDEDDEKLVD